MVEDRYLSIVEDCQSKLIEEYTFLKLQAKKAKKTFEKTRLNI